MPDLLIFGELALEAYFFLPKSGMCYRKINDREAACYPTSEKQVVQIDANQVVEYSWLRS